ncbi:MAG TPA: hypothetical protein VH877_16625 [Polyangia bacterium]|jgi:hypothetical protein|nr:hypothetical protein [Polyangia bacterium]
MAVESHAIADAERALVEHLVRDGFAPATIRTRASAGPMSTILVVAAAEGAYPGTGVRTALVHEGVVYGPRDGLADLVRACGWLASPPDATTLAAVASAVLFDDQLQLDTDSAAEPATQLTAEPGGLSLTLTHRLFPSGARERMRIHIPASGRETVQRVDEDPADRAPIPIDRATALVRALDAQDLMATLDAIQGIEAPSQPREFEALARAALHPNDTVAADALVKLGASDGAAAALRRALATTDEARRRSVAAMVSELWGSAFAARLEGR